jgi:YHS domain-containing protein
MKNFRWRPGIFLAVLMACIPLNVGAGDTNSVSAPPKPKPDLLKTCPVSGDKLGDMGKPYVFIYQGQEVKLCCPDCKAEFDKDPAKYIKKIRAADKPVKTDK